MKPAGYSDISTFDERVAAAEHIAVEASRLARMAKDKNFELLAYLIEMAVLEAWREAGEEYSSLDAESDSIPAPSP